MLVLLLISYYELKILTKLFDITVQFLSKFYRYVLQNNQNIVSGTGA